MHENERSGKNVSTTPVTTPMPTPVPKNPKMSRFEKIISTMLMHLPTQVCPARFGQDIRNQRRIHRDVMLKAVDADVAKQFLKSRDLRDGALAEGVERVVGGGSFADVSADDARGIVGGEARVGERARRSPAFHR